MSRMVRLSIRFRATFSPHAGRYPSRASDTGFCFDPVLSHGVVW